MSTQKIHKSRSLNSLVPFVWKFIPTHRKNNNTNKMFFLMRAKETSKRRTKLHKKGLKNGTKLYTVYCEGGGRKTQCAPQRTVLAHAVCPRSSDPFYVVTYYTK